MSEPRCPKEKDKYKYNFTFTQSESWITVLGIVSFSFPKWHYN